MDSLRPDHLGCYGYERDTSPAIDAFAAGAVRFDQAIASGSWTQPSIMSMMTSVPADIHQRVHWGRPHSTNVVTLPEPLVESAPNRAVHVWFNGTDNGTTRLEPPAESEPHAESAEPDSHAEGAEGAED